MTVTVTLPDGGADSYMRFGDAYVEHDNGALAVVSATAQVLHFSCRGHGMTWKVDQKS